MYRSIQTLFFLLFFLPVFAVSQTNNTCADTVDKCVGKKSFNDGRIYEGEFSFGLPNGNGKMYWADGSRFEGEWANGEMKYGSLLFTDGREYLGDFKNNKMEGNGSMIRPNGDVYNGEWIDGMENGNGTITRVDGSKFVGLFADGERIGEGKIEWNSGDMLEGIWDDNKLVGEVTTTFNNGDKLIHQWQNGRMRVNGTYYFSNGQEIQGSMKTIYYISTLEDEFDDEAIENHKSNLALAWYTFGMEFNTDREYDMANEFLLAALKYGPAGVNQQTMIANGLERVKTDQKNNAYAKLTGEK